MYAFARRSFSAILLVALVAPAASCGRTSDDGGQPPSQSGGTPAVGAGGATAGANQAGAAAASAGAGPDQSSAGAPDVIDPSAPFGACQENDMPGAPCAAGRCYGIRCGVRFELSCKGGAWKRGDSSPAWELACPAGNESVSNVGDIVTGVCCGELLPKNDVYSEPPSCNLCPEAAPDDGAPCSLPDECAPSVIDCFYKCCCYGDTIWAQCDGKRWHAATNCSDK